VSDAVTVEVAVVDFLLRLLAALICDDETSVPAGDCELRRVADRVAGGSPVRESGRRPPNARDVDASRDSGSCDCSAALVDVGASSSSEDSDSPELYVLADGGIGEEDRGDEGGVRPRTTLAA